MKKAFIITVSVLSCVIIIMGIYLFTTATSLTATTASLENLYQRSFYSLVDNVNNMEVEVSKLMVSNDSASQQQSLSKLKQQTSDAENDLSLLPISSNSMVNTTRFINQLNGYCGTLITYKDGTIEEENFKSLSDIYNGIATIKAELNSIMDKIVNGYKISDNLGNGTEIDNFTSNFETLSSDTIEYPAMIYDGPFSDALDKKSIKGLSEIIVNENEAETMITNVFENKITNLKYLGETKGKFETYDFGVNTENGGNYFVQITKRDGFLLTMSSNASSQATDDSLTINDSIKIAEDFAKKIGLENMKSVWSAMGNDVCYINLAPIIDDIVMYPDLVKVKIDINDKNIVGWEATSYAYNHTTRDELIPQLSEEEAKNLVSSNLQIENQKLCVIPLDFVGETLAYEFSGTYNDFEYYLYIDAYTGNQARVLRVIQTDNGELML